jgi:hypothetical protein
MNEQNDYSDLWSEMDELLIEYPELSELWLDRDKLASLRGRYATKDDLKEYYRKRAFTSLVMENIFRIFELTQEDQGDQEPEEAEGITLDNPELWRIWSEDVRDEYSDYPEFIEYVDKNVFVNSSP